MFNNRCVRLNIPSVLMIIICIVLNGVKYSNTAINRMEVSTKAEMKNNTANEYMAIFKTSPDIARDIAICPTHLSCNQLPGNCIFCAFNSSCIYGKEHQVTCEAPKGVLCMGDREFQRTTICRYCWQTEEYEHVCVQKDNCNSANHSFITNCTVRPDLLCLGKRMFLKRIRCNWTQGYKWSTALIISITLGGFGADRFYLGHWQEGIGKLFSFGGLGVWTLIDVILISLHYLGPADGSLYI